MLIAGAGLAGLVCAARLRELGHRPRVLEKGTRAGGSMLLSSCVIRRYRSVDEFHAECPAGDLELQRLVVERLDAAIEWLRSVGAPIVWEETGNPRTIGKRFDPPGLTEALLARAGEVRLSQPLPPETAEPVILATGGFSARLARERGLVVRSNPWSEGDGLDFARTRGAATAGDLHEFYGRAMPALAHVDESNFVPLTQLYGRYATVVAEDGGEFFAGPPNWAETDLAQAIAAQPTRTAWFLVDEQALGQRIRDRSVRDMVDAARAAGADVEERPDGRVAVRVTVGVTHTVGGLRIDTGARVLDELGRSIPGLWAAGADVGGIAGGGYASGLASALVLGLTAAESAAEAET
jgi:succinate dehydrogenase/fumarate reductase flavoprotein subunit